MNIIVVFVIFFGNGIYDYSKFLAFSDIEFDLLSACSFYPIATFLVLMCCCCVTYFDLPSL